MLKTDQEVKEKRREKDCVVVEMGLKGMIWERSNKIEKFRVHKPRMKLWMTRAITTVLLWTCVVQLMTLGEMWRPRLLMGWPSSSCFNSLSSSSSLDPTMVAQLNPSPKTTLRPKRIYKNNGYLMVSCNGGLNQMRAAICRMVVIARYQNATLIVPELDKTSFWADPSDFQDIFDADHFIGSLRDEVRILKELPPRLKTRVELGKYYSQSPISWSNISYYQNQVYLASTCASMPLKPGSTLREDIEGQHTLDPVLLRIYLFGGRPQQLPGHLLRVGWDLWLHGSVLMLILFLHSSPDCV